MRSVGFVFYRLLTSHACFWPFDNVLRISMANKPTSIRLAIISSMRARRFFRLPRLCVSILFVVCIVDDYRHVRLTFFPTTSLPPLRLTAIFTPIPSCLRISAHFHRKLYLLRTLALSSPIFPLQNLPLSTLNGHLEHTTHNEWGTLSHHIPAYAARPLPCCSSCVWPRFWRPLQNCPHHFVPILLNLLAKHRYTQFAYAQHIFAAFCAN